MTTATIELTKTQVAHREACAYLKGILCGYADRKGRPYHSKREPFEWSPAFTAGFNEGRDSWASADAITGTHIIHNRLRNRPPHAGGHGYTAWARGNLNMYLGDLAGELEGFLDE